MTQQKSTSFHQLTGLASHLVHEKLLTSDLALKSQHDANRQEINLVNYLVKNNILSSHIIFESCKNNFGLTTFDLDNYDNNWLQDTLLNEEIIQKYRVIPLKKENNILHIGISDPTDRQTIDIIKFYTGITIIPVIVQEDQLTKFIDTHFGNTFHNNLQLNILQELISEVNISTIQENSVNYDEPLVRFVDHLIQHALHQSASDIHIEPFETICRIRYRRDGILYEAAEVPIKLSARLVTRLKVMSKLDISERRLPQDGRFQLHNIDIRINTCPTLFGEKIVLRLLDANKSSLKIDDLGLTATQETIFLNKISQSQGMILVTGPTGSGKTVTLYSALHYLNTREKNISTVEDPVEIQLNGINQVNIHTKIGLHFSTVLRTFLRQDPDIIMVGEIRDLETAEIAIQAAQTGHLVLSTLHTNSAIETISRLQSIGVPFYNICTSISLIIAQRLARKLCSHCKQVEIIPANVFRNLGYSTIDTTQTIYRAIGCEYCLHGYRGRIGIYEFLSITKKLSQAILANENSINLLELARQEGFIPLREIGLELVLKGITSLTEITRVT